MTKINKKTIFSILLIIPIFAPHYNAYASDARAIPIGSIQGGMYTKTVILRQGIKLHPKLYFEILEEDKIISENKKTISIEAKICSDWINISLEPFSAYNFNQSCPGKLKSISSWFTSFIAAPLDKIYTASYEEGAPIVAATRNSNDENALSSLLIQAKVTLVSPGKKSLQIKWNGGTPPFTTSLFRNDTIVTNGRLNANSNYLKLPSIDFQENTKYKLLIQDSNGIEITRKIMVSRLPEYPEWRNEINNLSQTDKDLVTAIWLHDYSADRRWSLEAYNMLANRKDTPALLVINEILNDEDLNIPW